MLDGPDELVLVVACPEVGGVFAGVVGLVELDEQEPGHEHIGRVHALGQDTAELVVAGLLPAREQPVLEELEGEAAAGLDSLLALQHEIHVPLVQVTGAGDIRDISTDIVVAEQPNRPPQECRLCERRRWQ